MTSQNALAWNAAGHRLVSAVAWRSLDADTKTTIGEILQAHPDYGKWLARQPGRDPAYTAFLESSTWADDIRRDARFYDEKHDSNTAKPLLSGFSDMEQHRHWHHVDNPVFATRPAHTGKGELDVQLPRLMASLRNTSTKLPYRAYALVWLIHLFGDVHQPLHTVSYYDKEGNGDGGGNGLWVDTPNHPRLHGMTLHAYWDDLPGPPWLRGAKLEKVVDELPVATKRASTPDPSLADAVKGWMREGQQISEKIVYANLRDEDHEEPYISVKYETRAKQAAQERIAIAGGRLAYWLTKLLKK